jgi:hypothetical protein
MTEEVPIKHKRGRPKKGEVRPPPPKRIRKSKDPLVGTRKRGRRKIPMVVPCDDRLPAKEINFDQIRYWIDIGATCEEIAGSFYVSVDTLNRRIKEKYGIGFEELKNRSSGAAKIKLRLNQLKMSERNAAMGIWLGKIWLSQKDPDKLPDVKIDINSFKELFDNTRNPLAYDPFFRPEDQTFEPKLEIAQPLLDQEQERAEG